MNAAARKAASGGGRGPVPALVLVAAGVFAFLISYSLLAAVLRGGGDGGGGGIVAGAGAGGRDPVVRMPEWMRKAGGGRGRRRPFHVALTATDAAYSRWQCRVMYYWYKRMQARPEGADMGGFTRVLHSGKPDGLMDEIPTFVVDPLPAGKDRVSINNQFCFFRTVTPPSVRFRLFVCCATCGLPVQTSCVFGNLKRQTNKIRCFGCNFRLQNLVVLFFILLSGRFIFQTHWRGL
jgi:hypothetical protein